MELVHFYRGREAEVLLRIWTSPWKVLWIYKILIGGSRGEARKKWLPSMECSAELELWRVCERAWWMHGVPGRVWVILLFHWTQGISPKNTHHHTVQQISRHCNVPWWDEGRDPSYDLVQQEDQKVSLVIWFGLIQSLKKYTTSCMLLGSVQAGRTVSYLDSVPVAKCCIFMCWERMLSLWAGHCGLLLS